MKMRHNWKNDPRWKNFEDSCGAKWGESKAGETRGRDRTISCALKLLEVLESFEDAPPKGLHKDEKKLWEKDRFLPSRVLLSEMRQERRPEDRKAVAINSNELIRLADKLADAEILRKPYHKIIRTPRSKDEKKKQTFFYGLGRTGVISLQSGAQFETLEQKKARIIGTIKPYLGTTALKLGIDSEHLEAALLESIE
jgi:hypothetical protein